jgi:hypothetical protein
MNSARFIMIYILRSLVIIEVYQGWKDHERSDCLSSQRVSDRRQGIYEEINSGSCDHSDNNRVFMRMRGRSGPGTGIAGYGKE